MENNAINKIDVFDVPLSAGCYPGFSNEVGLSIKFFLANEVFI